MISDLFLSQVQIFLFVLCFEYLLWFFNNEYFCFSIFEFNWCRNDKSQTSRFESNSCHGWRCWTSHKYNLLSFFIVWNWCHFELKICTHIEKQNRLVPSLSILQTEQVLPFCLLQSIFFKDNVSQNFDFVWIEISENPILLKENNIFVIFLEVLIVYGIVFWLKFCGGLEQLSLLYLPYTHISDVSLQSLSKMTTLQSLKISFCFDISDNGIFHLQGTFLRSSSHINTDISLCPQTEKYNNLRMRITILFSNQDWRIWHHLIWAVQRLQISRLSTSRIWNVSTHWRCGMIDTTFLPIQQNLFNFWHCYYCSGKQKYLIQPFKRLLVCSSIYCEVWRKIVSLLFGFQSSVRSCTVRCSNLQERNRNIHL